jgi:hypothetical protein
MATTTLAAVPGVRWNVAVTIDSVVGKIGPKQNPIRITASVVKRAMIAGAAEVVALASAEKLGTAALYIVGC